MNNQKINTSLSDLHKTELIASYLPICIGHNPEQKETKTLWTVKSPSALTHLIVTQT